MRRENFKILVLSLLFIMGGFLYLETDMNVFTKRVKAQDLKNKLINLKRENELYLNNIYIDTELRNVEKEEILFKGLKVMTQTEKEIKNNMTLEERMSEIISEVARQEDFNSKELLLAMAKAESSLDPDIRGRVDNRDRGLFQINSYYNNSVSDECAFDPWCATRWVIKELNNGNEWKWNPSRHGWGEYLTK